MFINFTHGVKLSTLPVPLLHTNTVKCQICTFGYCSAFQFSNRNGDVRSVSQPRRRVSCEEKSSKYRAQCENHLR